MTADNSIEIFIQRWRNAGGSERANYQLFLTELCELLDLPRPDPAGDDTRDNTYVFERRVLIKNPDGSGNNGFIDLYKRGSFVLEAKQTGKTLDSSGWDKAMLRAHNQADHYVRALPADEGRPPFILVTDVGRNIELYAEFSRSGATYTPFPDPLSHRIRLEDLRKAEIRHRLRAVWLDPLSLDPSRRAARVTREVADQLARLAKSLEAGGQHPERVAGFLMRCLFTMFAEDVGLLPERGFTDLLERLANKPDTFAPMLEHLWQTMNSGGFSPILESNVLRFNGGLFADASAIPLDRDQMELLAQAAHADWRYVEPTIFGTLLERALDPRERHKLGAHYTPRSYVERLVLPTIIEPLRGEWREVQAAALTYEQQGKHKEALKEVKDFHRHLCDVKVLDPACGSGNFLYVTLEHMKRLEGEVLNLLHDLGESQGLLQLEGVTVDPHQFLGLEINPRAATIAEMVLWIGYLQWHFRTHGNINPPEPVLRDFHNIEHRDALIDYDARELVTDDSGVPLTRWDGVTTKASPITGEQIPDESAQVPQYRYINPRRAAWPQADYIVGNPPFVGNKRMRLALGDGYVDAVRNTWREVPDTSDFVMYWWHKSAELVRDRKLRRFGLITTNSLKQVFSRKVLEQHLTAKNPLSLVFAIPDHPWVDSTDGADVRIAMTVGAPPGELGTLARVIAEADGADDEIDVRLSNRTGEIHADLSIGAAISRAQPLSANSGICFQGMNLVGKGFRLSGNEVTALGYDIAALPDVIKPHFNARDLMQNGESCWVIDLFGLSADDAKAQHPALYNRLLVRVKPERDQNKRESRKRNWWLFGEPVGRLRKAWARLPRVILTPETAKHRVFTFVDRPFCPDHKLYAVCSDDAFNLGILSSRIQASWALAAGGRMGVGNDPVFNNTRCFARFPFPDAGPEAQAQIRKLAEGIDAHRKRQQAEHPKLTLTGIYNVLEKIRAEQPLDAKEKLVHEQGLVSVLRELHDELDRVVFAAYGWQDLAAQLVGRPGATTPLPDKPVAQAEAEEELLSRLVALNAERAAEEARGKIRWLRPEYQNPNRNPAATAAPQQAQADLAIEQQPAAATKIPEGKQPWPKQMREQVAAVRAALTNGALPLAAIAAQFKRSPQDKVRAVLEALQELGMVREEAGHYRLAN
ncbi:class I SAM-dependent DNA methyltransferase [Microbulbifer magnicolonia]|uniref:class I SAM-dependent DNA methyltransferase n=1 Tax=Microbulbifer magnicolonia TaxID=3109744 RepID=UPI002B4067D0|nr:DNA methyltransferase [Microbulbifer sp. GG15]